MIFKDITPEDRTKAGMLTITKDEYSPELSPSRAVLMSAVEMDFFTRAIRRAKDIVEGKIITAPTDELIEIDESLINYTLDWESANTALKEFRQEATPQQ